MIKLCEILSAYQMIQLLFVNHKPSIIVVLDICLHTWPVAWYKSTSLNAIVKGLNYSSQGIVLSECFIQAYNLDLRCYFSSISLLCCLGQRLSILLITDVLVYLSNVSSISSSSPNRRLTWALVCKSLRVWVLQRRLVKQ